MRNDARRAPQAEDVAAHEHAERVAPVAAARRASGRTGRGKARRAVRRLPVRADPAMVEVLAECCAQRLGVQLAQGVAARATAG